MKKSLLTFLIYLSILSLNASDNPIEESQSSNEHVLNDFTMVNVESVDVIPNLKTQKLILKITVLFWQVFKYQTFEMELGWDSSELLNIKAGEQIGWKNQELDYANFGYAFYDVYFPNSNVIITAKGRSNKRLDLLDDKESLRHVFSLTDNQEEYLSFFSEGNTKWLIDNNHPLDLKNGDSFYIDYASERFAPKKIGASIFKIFSQSGHEIGEIMGQSTKDWEPSKDENRIFTVLNRNEQSFDQCDATLRHDKTGKEFFLRGFSFATEGEKIFVIGRSKCNNLIYYILDRKESIGDKDSCGRRQYGYEQDISIHWIGWTDDFQEVSIFLDDSYNYWENPGLFRANEEGVAWFIKDFCPRRANWDEGISVSDFFNIITHYCIVNSMRNPSLMELHYGSPLSRILNWSEIYGRVHLGCDS